ncbi:hypothetical protein EJP67_02695 [Variovorax guangxiensis]|uniref:Tetratricopeptide repeat protein n=1 Tax=Variovorax guangxiensis TaxID=1775474 RepID=A0A3S0XPD4_9BURK|nr:hypothetical protein [Variovorax guangxiensis]RUR65960.1 hypothetical protein EJP67_02695 [Variovorax guangxiensis]
MPFLGLGLHVLIALFFAVHAMRHGKQMYWLLILFSFPLLGSIVYFVVEYLPASRMQRTAGKVANAAIGFIDPEREYRAAAEAYDLAPTAQNKLRLARAALDRGQAADAVGHYRDALKGPLASDPELQFGLASALLAAGGATAGRDALQALHTLRSTRDDYRKDEVAVLTARALAADSQQAEARQAFEDALGRYNTVEARARYIAWLAQQGDTAGAQRQWDELQQAARHWNSHARSVNREWMRLAGDAVRG